MLVVAAFECRDEKASILQVETFDNRTLNITALAEVALALMIARGAALTSLLGAAALTGTQWLYGALPALVRAGSVEAVVPAPRVPAAA